MKLTTVLLTGGSALFTTTNGLVIPKDSSHPDRLNSTVVFQYGPGPVLPAATETSANSSGLRANELPHSLGAALPRKTLPPMFDATRLPTHNVVDLSHFTNSLGTNGHSSAVVHDPSSVETAKPERSSFIDVVGGPGPVAGPANPSSAEDEVKAESTSVFIIGGPGAAKPYGTLPHMAYVTQV